MKKETIKELKNELKKFKKQIILASSLIPITWFGANISDIYADAVANKEIKMYDKTIDDLKDLFIKNGITEPDDIFKNFTYSLWNGYLSYNQSFKYDKSVDNSISDKYLGTGCLSGKAVCSHMASMLNDLYEAYGYESCTLACFLDDGKSDDLKLIGNHLITSVLLDDKIYYYDPTNRTNLFKSDDNELATAGIEDITVKLCYATSLLDYGGDFIDIESIKKSTPNQRYVEPVEINRDVSLKDLISFYNNHETYYEKVFNKKQSIYNETQVRTFGLVFTITMTLTDGIVCCITIYRQPKKEKQLLKK